MSVAPSDLMLYAGGECLDRHGVLVKRTSPREEAPEVFTRSGTGLYVARGGQLLSAAANVPRISYLDIEGDGEIDDPAWLLEGAGTNLCLQSENFGTTWVAGGTPTRSAAAHTASGVTLDLIGDDDAGGTEWYDQNITFTGDATKAVSVHMKEGAIPATTQVDMTDTTAVLVRLRATVSWSGGVPTVTMLVGTHTGTELLAGGVYRFLFAAPSVVAANTNQLRILPAILPGNIGNVYAGGFQAENAPVATSYIRTTTVAVTRGAEVAYLPFARPPQAMTIYARFAARGLLSVSGARLLHIGLTGASTDPRLYIGESSGFFRVGHDNGTAEVTSTLAAAPSFGQMVELRAVLNADGSVQIHQSIAAAAEVSASASSAPSGGLADAWAGERLYLAADPAGGNGGFASFVALKIASGVYSLADMREAV